MKKEPKTKVAASLTVYAIQDMTIEGRMNICKWLRRMAKDIQVHPATFAKTFKARYMYLPMLAVAMLVSGCTSFDWPTLPDVPQPGTNVVVVPPSVPAEPTVVPWNRATLASLWDGKNAERRMMNLLSPKFSDAKVAEYIAWQKGRGCNTTDLILSNKGDGDGAGYCLYGAAFDWSVDPATVARMNARILQCLKAGLAVNVWLMTDDGTDWNRAALSDPARYCRDLAAAGLLRYASSVCVGLELTEYATKDGLSDSVVKGQVQGMVAALRGVYGGKVATHHNSGRLDFAGLADLVWIQESPGVSESALGVSIDRAKATGRPVRCFEVSRNPNRALCEFAMRKGCYSVGNW